MPLPFSFSTQRQASEGEFPSGGADISVAEKIMGNGPGHVSTEPLLGTPGNVFTPPALTPPPRAVSELPKLAAAHFPPAPSPNMRPAAHPPAVPASISHAMQATVVQPAAPGRPDTAALHEWSSQLDQLRNDVFGIAMSVSALRDRIDRLEHRMTSDDQTTQSSLQKLRGEVEVWLENHLNAAVEHCMQRIISRPPAPVTTHAN